MTKGQVFYRCAEFVAASTTIFWTNNQHEWVRSLSTIPRGYGGSVGSELDGRRDLHTKRSAGIFRQEGARPLCYIIRVIVAAPDTRWLRQQEGVPTP